MSVSSSSVFGFRFGWVGKHNCTKKNQLSSLPFSRTDVDGDKDLTARCVKKFKSGCLSTRKSYDTRCSQAVPHPSTILARRCLTSMIRREWVYSTWCGRRHRNALLLQSGSELPIPGAAIIFCTATPSSSQRHTGRVQIKKYQISNSH